MSAEHIKPGVDEDARRRFWLVRKLIKRYSAEETLEYATRLESFIAGRPRLEDQHKEVQSAESSAAKLDNMDRREVDPVVHERNGVSLDQARNTTVAVSGETQRTGGQGGLMSRPDRARFAAAVNNGATNPELARMFGLTPRQVHCLRLALKRKARSPKAPVAAGGPEAVLNREAELRLQDEFLRKRGLPAPSIEDVVRFLRQRGDIVVKTDAGYLVNSHLRLTQEQLVARANKFCVGSGRPIFTVPGIDLKNVEPALLFAGARAPQEKSDSAEVDVHVARADAGVALPVDSAA